MDDLSIFYRLRATAEIIRLLLIVSINYLVSHQWDFPLKKARDRAQFSVFRDSIRFCMRMKIQFLSSLSKTLNGKWLTSNSFKIQNDMHHELRHTAKKQSERQRFPTEDRVVSLRFLFITFRVFHWNVLRHVIPKLFKFTRGFIFYKENGAGSSINGQEGSNTFKKYLFTEK